MFVVNLILYILAAVCFFLAMLGVPAPRVNLLAAGLLALVLVSLLGMVV